MSLFPSVFFCIIVVRFLFFLMDRLIVFILGFVAFVLILKYRKWLRDTIGEIAFAEKIFMMGGTNTLIVLIGIAVFVLSLMYGLGTLQALLQAVLGPFFGK